MPDLKWKNRIMLIFSLIFYAWAGPAYLLLLIGMTFADWVVALQMSKNWERPARKRWLVIGCVINIGLLCIFKYLTFFLQNFHNWFGVPENVLAITLPIGISFYTFQLLSYMVDVYRQEVKPQENFFRLLLYVSLFHQCIAGPIVRYEHVEHELTERKATLTDFSYGIRRFTIGLAKKALLANTCGSLADTFLAPTSGDNILTTLSSQPVLAVWLGMIAYTMQIYLDFSAYSDMAIGMGRMIGFHYHENFNYPYISASVTEFWRRWHISLSTFFRDYVYIPLGGNRVSQLRHILNLLIVWALTGFWHGAQWNFLFWGLYYGLLLLAEKLFLGRLLERLPKAVRWLYTAFFVLIGWVLFDLTDFPSLCHALKLMFVPQATDWVAAAATNVSLLKAVVYLPLGIVCCLPLLRREPKSAKGILLANLASGLLLIVCIVFILSSSYNPFIYFRF